MKRTGITKPISAHFIGIGGAGMSGIARVMHDRGDKVTGSDLKESRYTKALLEAGVPVTIGHDAALIGDVDIVVVSSAIRQDNPELVEARRRGIEIWPRARMLAHLAGTAVTIAVAGTHGKTSTSAMTATMLEHIGEDPTFVIGGEVAEFSVNAKAGNGTKYVVEADESDGSFLYLEPSVALVTNVEAEHLDHYGSLEAVEQSFVEFMARVSPDGVLVLCADDRRLLELSAQLSTRRVTYGFAEDADVRCHLLERDGMGHRFSVTLPDGMVVQATMPVPGEHMVQNGTGVIAIAYELGCDVQAAARALSSYRGVKRRFDRIGSAWGVTVVDDYAHHPTEIKATLMAARDCGYDRVWVVFQPHRYSRTDAFAEEFGRAFCEADRIVLMDVYSAGETPVPGVSGKTILDAVLSATPRARVAYLPHRVDVAKYLAANVQSGDLVLTMGAGDVTTVGPDVLRAINARRDQLSCQ